MPANETQSTTGLAYTAHQHILSGLVFFVGKAKVLHPSGDSRLNLLVSQNILKHHTIKLNNYKDKIDHYALVEVNGNHYDYFPLGTSLLALPAVYIANSKGLDMSRTKDNAIAHKYIITFLNPLIFIFLFLIGRHYVSDKAAYFISLISFLGSSLTSSLSIGLHSHNFAVLFTVIALFQLVRHDSDSPKRLNPYLLGFFLFLAYFTRPTFSIFILMVFTYLFMKNRRLLLKTSATSLTLLLIFVIFSLVEYAQFLPPYYMGRLGTKTFFTALYGLTFSPSRGLFIFSPFLLPVVAATLYYFRHLKKHTLFVLSLGWAAGHLILVSSFETWTGGHSFGPRLVLDSLPAYILVTFVLWKHLSSKTMNTALRYSAICLYLTLGILGVWINAYQGANNIWTVRWNSHPEFALDINRFAFDWKYPQFLATPESIRNRIHDYYGEGRFDVTIKHDTQEIIAVDLVSPRDIDAFMVRAQYYLDKKNYTQAIEDYSTAIEMSPKNLLAYKNRTNIYMELGSYKSAVSDLTKLIEMEPGNAKLYFLRGFAYDELNAFKAAIEDYSTYLSLNPSDGNGHLSRAIVSFRAGDYDKADSYLNSTASLLPKTPLVYIYLGMSAYIKGSYDEAYGHFEETLKLNSKEDKTWLFTYNAIRRSQGAAIPVFLRRFSNHISDTPSSLFTRTISKYYLGMKGLDEKTVLEKARNLNGNALCEAYYYLAENRQANGNINGADKFFRKCLKECPQRLPEYHAAKALLQ